MWFSSRLPAPGRAEPKAPVVGYRAWRLAGGRLVSPLFNEAAWPERSAMAALCGKPVGKMGDHLVSCHCGIHAYYDVNDLLKGLYPGTASEDFVVGAVAGFGPMALCQMGFRAAYAIPLAIASPSSTHAYMRDKGFDYWAGSRLLPPKDTLAGAVCMRYELPLVNMGELAGETAPGHSRVRPARIKRTSPNPANPGVAIGPTRAGRALSLIPWLPKTRKGEPNLGHQSLPFH